MTLTSPRLTTGGAGLDSAADPPMVAALVQPLVALRASLGTGVATPDPTVTTALSSATTQAAQTETPHREGVHALESTWTGAGADSAVPALRTTQTQLGDITDRGPAYLSVLADAHATSARAAQRMDQIIGDFRRDARTMLSTANSAPDTDAVINRATQAMRDAIGTVTQAQSEMDGYSRTLDQMGPLTVTTPAALDDSTGDSASNMPPDNLSDSSDGSGNSFGNSNSEQWSNPPGAGLGGSDLFGGGFGGGFSPGAMYANGQQLDPAQAAQMQLQEQLMAAGVDVGTEAIQAGVQLGTDLIDKVADVGEHGMDILGQSATQAMDQVVPALLHPGTNQQNGSDPNNPNGSSSLFNFGPGVGSPQAGSPSPAAPGQPGVVIPPAPNQPAPAPPADPAPAPQSNPAAPPVNTAPPQPNPPPAPNSDPPAPQQQGTVGGMALPSPGTAGDQDHKPNTEGQLGVTAPAAASMVPVPVIGDFGDEFGE